MKEENYPQWPRKPERGSDRLWGWKWIQTAQNSGCTRLNLGSFGSVKQRKRGSLAEAVNVRETPVEECQIRAKVKLVLLWGTFLPTCLRYHLEREWSEAPLQLKCTSSWLCAHRRLRCRAVYFPTCLICSVWWDNMNYFKWCAALES